MQHPDDAQDNDIGCTQSPISQCTGSRASRNGDSSGQSELDDGDHALQMPGLISIPILPLIPNTLGRKGQPGG